MGNLFIVATPIGNLEDITIRASRILLSSRIIIAESASKAGILLKSIEKQFPQIKNTDHKIISFSEAEEENKIPEIIKLLEQNDVSLISEAGTPLISDPGFKLIRDAVRRNVQIIPVPGANAAITALSASGLPTDKFLFLGFLPKQENKRIKALEFSKLTGVTTILYESPHRIDSSLQTTEKVYGNAEIVIARELTKMHEEILRGKIEDFLSGKIKLTRKGEFTIILR